MIESHGGFQSFFPHRPKYLLFFGLWMNRDRAIYRKARPVEVGTSVAFGGDPGIGYYRAIADTDTEANILCKQAEAMRDASRSARGPGG